MAERFFNLDGKSAFVTGGGQGIGEAICRRLAAAGAKVGVFDLDAGKAQRVALDIGGLGLAGSVTSEADVETAVEELHQHFGSVDILVNNAGITGTAGKLWEITLDDWKSVLDVNVIGPVVCCRAVVPHMRQRKYGRIVNIASIAGKEGNPTLGPYSASKAALIALTKSLAKELVGQGDITVNSISPAVIHTPILDGLPQTTVDYMVSRNPKGRTGKPEEVAALVHYLASSDASFTTGQCYDISGGRATY
jgi:3-oxoacyl-[acyl-carrier protein] reductase